MLTANALDGPAARDVAIHPSMLAFKVTVIYIGRMATGGSPMTVTWNRAQRPGRADRDRNPEADRAPVTLRPSPRRESRYRRRSP